MSAVNAFSPELIARICQECTDDVYTRCTLLSLAKTCRAFSPVALKFLWSELTYEPNPLFLVLPEGSVLRRERDAKDNMPPSYVLYPARASFSTSELERFCFYAEFVQSLTVPVLPTVGGSIAIVCPDIWRQLKPPHGPIFPNLRTLSFRLNWSQQAQDPVPLRYFFGPNLEILRVEFGFGEPEGQLEDLESDTTHAATSLIELLVNLPHQSPLLRQLYLNKTGPAIYAQGPLTQALQGLSSLTTFEAIESTPLSPDGVLVLSSLPSLVSAAFAAQAADYLLLHDNADERIDSTNFPALRKLQLVVDTAECGMSLLSWPVIDPPGLNELEVKVDVETNITPFQLASITATLPAKRCRTTLDTVILCGCNNVDFDSPPPVAYPPSAIVPLYALPALRQLHLRGNCYAALDDATLADMAYAWPHIEHLHLCQEGAGPAARVTLAGLRDFAAGLPHIQELYVALGDIKRAVCEEILERRPPSPALRDGVNGTPQVQSNLWALSLGEPSIQSEDVFAVAAVLAMTFPSLRGLKREKLSAALKMYGCRNVNMLLAGLV
ncbi:hypothetical protein VTO73DRAFT_80 [Trametes versicolor]